MSFADALQGMPVLTGEFHHLFDELVRILRRIDTANTAAVTIGCQHDVDGFFVGFAEHAFEHPNYECHRCLLVVQQHDNRFFRCPESLPTLAASVPMHNQCLRLAVNPFSDLIGTVLM
jgi:hypothetical protein